VEGEQHTGLSHAFLFDFDFDDDVYTAAAETATVRSVVKGEMSAKTTHQRSAKGPTSIGDCSADGKFITLENTGRKVYVFSHSLITARCT